MSSESSLAGNVYFTQLVFAGYRKVCQASPLTLLFNVVSETFLEGSYNYRRNLRISTREIASWPRLQV